jgi:hypothetical protein
LGSLTRWAGGAVGFTSCTAGFGVGVFAASVGVSSGFAVSAGFFDASGSAPFFAASGLAVFGIELVVGALTVFADGALVDCGAFAGVLAVLVTASASFLPADAGLGDNAGFAGWSVDAPVCVLLKLLSALALESFDAAELLLLLGVGFFAFATLHTLLILTCAR